MHSRPAVPAVTQSLGIRAQTDQPAAPAGPTIAVLRSCAAARADPDMAVAAEGYIQKYECTKYGQNKVHNTCKN